MGADKVGHFAACATVTWAAWVLLQRASASKTGPGVVRGRLPRSRALLIAVAAGLVVGVAKEALDAAGVSTLPARQRDKNAQHSLTSVALSTQLWPTGGAPSFRDFVADAAGSLAAAGVIVTRSAAPPAQDHEKLSAAGDQLQEV